MSDFEVVQGERVALSVRAGDGLAFACALARDGNGWSAPAEDYAAGPTCAFGAIAVSHERRSHAEVDITLVEMQPRDEGRTARLERWVEASASTVGAYFGRFPVDRLLLVITPNESAGFAYGRARGEGGATIEIAVGAHDDDAAFRGDWMLTHEMIHLALPALPRAHHWLEEGSATYFEPLARAAAGMLGPDTVWRAMLDEFPQGLARPGSDGLDEDASWGRTYYGGAIFCLEADLRIRVRTGGRYSLRDAFAAVVAAGGNLTHDWPLERVLELGDRATGTSVLTELHAETGSEAWPLEVDSTWKRVGVAIEGGKLVYDDSAPLASVRRDLVRADR